MVVDLTLRDRASEQRCPYCHGRVTLADEGWVCESCGTIHHRECFREHGRCAVHGCAKNRGAVRPSPCGPPPRAPRRWLGAAAAVCVLGVVAVLGFVAVQEPRVVSVERLLPSQPTQSDEPRPARASTLAITTPTIALASGRPVGGMTFQCDCHLSVFRESGEIDYVSATGGRAISNIRRAPRQTFIDVCRDRRRAIVGTRESDEDRNLRLVDLGWNDCPELGRTRRSGERWRSAALAPDGVHALVATHSGELELWDMERGTKVASCAGEPDVRQVAISGRTAITGHKDGSLRTWSLPALARRDHVPLQCGEVVALRAREDGECAVGCATFHDMTVLLVDVSSGAVATTLRVLLGGYAFANLLVFDRDGTRAFSSTTSGELTFWDLSAKAVRRLDDVSEDRTACFSRDGSLVAAAGSDGQIVVRPFSVK